jgi:hypothetical protein
MAEKGDCDVDFPECFVISLSLVLPAVFGTYLFTICVFVSCSTGSSIFRDGLLPLYVAALYKRIHDSNSAVSELRALPSPYSGL